MVKKLLAVAVVIAVGSVMSADLFAAGAGTTGAQFLKISPGAKPMGMGGAYSAVSGDSNGIYYNPACLAGMEAKELGFTYLQHFEDTSAGVLSAVFPSGSGAIGAGLTYLSVANIERRTADTADAIDTFGATDMMLTVAYAKKDMFMEGVYCGANLKIISQTIDVQAASSLAVDLAGLYPVSEKFTIGANLQNLGTGVKFSESEATDQLPLNLKLGAGLKAGEKLLIASDIDVGLADSANYVAIGGEYLLNEMIALRLGYRIGYDTASLGSLVGFTLGLGFTKSSFGVDLAVVPFGDMGTALRLSLNMKL